MLHFKFKPKKLLENIHLWIIFIFLDNQISLKPNYLLK